MHVFHLLAVIYIGKVLAELNLLLAAYGMKSCPSRSALERCSPVEMHSMELIHFLISRRGVCFCKETMGEP